MNLVVDMSIFNYTGHVVHVKCYRCGQWLTVPWSGFIQRKVCFCDNPKCKKALKEWHYANRQAINARYQAAHKTIKTEPCLHCGRAVELVGKSANSQYIYCPAPECQQARADAAKERSRLASAYYRGVGVKKKIVFEDLQTWIGPCMKCGKPTKRDSLHGFCPRCRHQNETQSFNEDCLYLDCSGVDLEESLGGELI